MKNIRFDGNTITPSKIMCIGRNYVAHIKELNNELPTEPVIFIKPNSAIADEIYFNENDSIHYEGEITFLILSGKIAGIGFGLDLTKRDIQSQLKSQGLPWERAKSFDKSAVFSQFIPFNGNCQDISMTLQINGVVTQHANYALMINKPNGILSEASKFLSFEDGDLIMTGTPKGVGEIHRGDEFLGKIFNKEQLIIEATWTVK